MNYHLFRRLVDLNIGHFSVVVDATQGHKWSKGKVGVLEFRHLFPRSFRPQVGQLGLRQLGNRSTSVYQRAQRSVSRVIAVVFFRSAFVCRPVLLVRRNHLAIPKQCRQMKHIIERNTLGVRCRSKPWPCCRGCERLVREMTLVHQADPPTKTKRKYMRGKQRRGTGI